jgi:cytochrome b561
MATESVPPQGYRRPQIVLHWLVFLLVAFLFFTGDNMTDAFDAMRKSGGSAWSYAWIPIHMTAGVAVLVFMLWRLSLRRRFGAPPPPQDEPAPLRILAVSVHHLLYLLFILAPIGGLVGFFLIPKAADIHELMVRIPLMILVGLHVAGALWHQFVVRDNVLSRMWRPI